MHILIIIITWAFFFTNDYYIQPMNTFGHADANIEAILQDNDTILIVAEDCISIVAKQQSDEIKTNEIYCDKEKPST